jgi:hypothetical protein
MINFKQRDEILPSFIILASLIILLATLIFRLFAPMPSGKGLVQSNGLQTVMMQSQTRSATARWKSAAKAISPKVWAGDPDTVSGSVLAILTNDALANSLKLGAFRPQRTIVLTGMTELPFAVQITGSYKGVRAVMQSLDARGSKVILRSVQISSTEQETQAVTATLGLSVYLPDPDVAEELTKGGHHG